MPVAKALKREEFARTLVKLVKKKKNGPESRAIQLKLYRKKGGNTCDCSHNCMKIA